MMPALPLTHFVLSTSLIIHVKEERRRIEEEEEVGFSIFVVVTPRSYVDGIWTRPDFVPFLGELFFATKTFWKLFHLLKNNVY